MDSNDILRRLRYTFSFNDRQMIAVFAEAEHRVTREQVDAWLKRDDDPAFEALDDVRLATFLNGLIVRHRGKRDGTLPVAERQLSNNVVFRKLKIALNLKDTDILGLMARAGFPIGKSELSALFRKPGHKNYRECKDQILRNFLKGLQLEHRVDAPSD
ncbi:MAG: DUF1456 family protein [bacterium]|nr:DUF1456 family protein [bacterium]